MPLEVIEVHMCSMFQVRRLAHFVLVLGLFVLYEAPPMYAQGAEGREAVTITISRNVNGACTYEIDGEGQNQDLFLVKPNAPITFRPVGTNARVDIERHRARGPLEGTRGLSANQSPVFDLTDGNPVVRNARASLGTQGNFHTTHKVWILCLDADGNEELSIDKASDGTASLIRPFENRFGEDEALGSGPSRPDKEGQLLVSEGAIHRGGGGPEMEVDDP